MKKLLICLFCVNFLVSFSFSSSAGPEQGDFTDKILISEAIMIEDDGNTSSSGNITEKKNSNAPYEYPELSDIEEPIIKTIEPESEEENDIKEELVKTELPPIGNEESDKSKSNTKAGKAAGEDAKPEPPVKNKSNKPEETMTAEKKEKAEEPKKTEKIEEVVEENIEPVIDIIRPSRSVTLKRKEYIDITYPGTGWIYTGIIDGSKDLSYFGRALGTKDTTFTLQAVIPGTKVLHFCKNDYLTGEYLDDYIEIVILEEEGSNKTHVEAPEYRQPDPERDGDTAGDAVTTEDRAGDTAVGARNTAETEVKASDQQKTKPAQKPQTKNKSEDLAKASNQNKQESSYKNEQYSKYDQSDKVTIPLSENKEITIPEEVVVETSKNSDVTDSSTLLKEANFLYNEREYKAAYDKVETYLQYSAENIDEGLLLKGKILEAQSDIQDIRGAIKIYNTLMKEYPASKHWNEANKRVIYLKRFYLEVR